MPQRSSLHVEGTDDKHAIKHLLLRHGVECPLAGDVIPETLPAIIPEIKPAGDKDKVLDAMAPAVRFGTGHSVGFVVDADEAAARGRAGNKGRRGRACPVPLSRSAGNSGVGARVAPTKLPRNSTVCGLVPWKSAICSGPCRDGQFRHRWTSPTSELLAQKHHGLIPRVVVEFSEPLVTQAFIEFRCLKAIGCQVSATTSPSPPQLLPGRDQTAAQTLAPLIRVHPERFNRQPSIRNVTNQTGHDFIFRAAHRQNNLARIRIPMSRPIVLP